MCLEKFLGYSYHTINIEKNQQVAERPFSNVSKMVFPGNTMCSRFFPPKKPDE
jgi:hypothetical protein